MQHPKATLQEIEDAVDERLRRLRKRMVEDAVQASGAADWSQHPKEERPRCTRAGRRSSRVGSRSGDCKRKAEHRWSWSAAMAPAPGVGAGFFPLDEELGLEAGSLTPQLLEWLVRLAAWMPFARAVQLLEAITEVSVGKETARRPTEQAGKLVEEEQDAQAMRLMDVRQEVKQEQDEPAARQVFSADGAMVPLVHGVWAEVKLLVVAEQARDKEGRMQLVKPSYYARMVEAQDFADLALVETRRVAWRMRRRWPP